MRLHEWVDRPNLYVKIPATEPGLGAIEESIARGRNINVTLIFALERYEAVARRTSAASSGWSSRAAILRASRPSRPSSSRASTPRPTSGSRRSDRGALALRGKLAIANAKLAYERYKEIFSGERWSALAAKGATKQRCLWASTSTKNPEYRDVMYVEELIGPATVNTMPIETIGAFQDHGVVADTLEQGVDDAHRLFET